MQGVAGGSSFFHKILMTECKGVRIHNECSRFTLGLCFFQIAQIRAESIPAVFHKDKRIFDTGDLIESQIPEEFGAFYFGVEEQMQIAPCTLNFDQVRNDLVQDLGGLCLQFGNGVDAPTAAYFGRAAADEAAPPRKRQLFAVYFCAIGPENIHIEQPPQRSGILNVRCEFFDRHRVRVQNIKRFTVGIRVQGRQFCTEKLLAEQLLSACKSAPDERRILDWPCNVHRKADERFVISLQKFLLVVHPAFAGIQHVQK